MTADQEKDPEVGPSEALERLVGQVGQALSASGAAADGEVTAEGTREEIVQQVLLSETYKGSFAHPRILRQMNEVIPNGAERAFSMTEREQAHRHDCDKRLIDSEVECNKREYQDRRLAIVGAFIFLFVGLILSFVAILLGHKVGAGLGGGAALVAIIGLFGIRRQVNKNKE